MAERVSQAPRRVAIVPDPNARVSQAPRRVAIVPDPNARVSQLSRRVAVANYTTPNQAIHVTILD